MIHGMTDVASAQSWKRYRYTSLAMLMLALVPVLLLLKMERMSFILVYLAIPVALVAVSMPRRSFYLFMIANYIYMPVRMALFAIHPGDVCAILFIGAVFISWVFRYQPNFDRTRFDFSLLALILATVISGVFSYSPRLSIVPIGRIILIYMAYRALYTFSGKFNPDRMVRFFINLHALISLWHTVLFLAGSGRVRVFGVSSVGFETFSLTMVPLTLAYAIWAQSRRERIRFTLFFLLGVMAAMATMSRGPLITITAACPVLLLVSYVYAKRLHRPVVRRYVFKLVMVAVPLLLVIIFGTGLYTQLGERVEQIFADKATGTILTRFSLWKSAIEAFTISPVTGIGIGNYHLLDSLLPHLKFDPVRVRVAQLSFHNVSLQYLAETGILGISALFWLAGSIFITGRRIIRKTTDAMDMQLSMSCFIYAFIFCITIFYMRVWTWGQEGFVLAFCLALLSRQYRHLYKQSRGDS